MGESDIPIFNIYAISWDPHPLQEDRGTRTQKLLDTLAIEVNKEMVALACALSMEVTERAKLQNMWICHKCWRWNYAFKELNIDLLWRLCRLTYSYFGSAGISSSSYLKLTSAHTLGVLFYYKSRKTCTERKSRYVQRVSRSRWGQ